jgi:hypothetical protein
MLIERKIDCIADGVYDIPHDRFVEVLNEADVDLRVDPNSEVILRCFQEKYKAFITEERTEGLTTRQYEIVIGLMRDYFKFYGL